MKNGGSIFWKEIELYDYGIIVHKKYKEYRTKSFAPALQAALTVRLPITSRTSILPSNDNSSKQKGAIWSRK